MAFTLQFRDLTVPSTLEEAVHPPPSNVAKYVQDFDARLPDEEMRSPHFRCRFLFTPLVTNKKAQADKVMEFVREESQLGQSITKEYDQIYLKEVERAKHLPGELVTMMRSEGHIGFNMHDHTVVWKTMDAKNPGKGFGVVVGKTWYWYDRWVDEVRKHCMANLDKYTTVAKKVALA